MDSLSAKSSGVPDAMKKARSILRYLVDAKGKTSLVGLAAVGIACVLAPSKPALHAEEAARAADEKNWQAVAPGRVEPGSGEIKIPAPLAGLLREVLVQAGVKVSARDPL